MAFDAGYSSGFPSEEIGLLDADRLADQLEKIDDSERRCGFVGAQLAMAGVVDADEIIDSGRGRRPRRGDIGSSNGFNRSSS